MKTRVISAVLMIIAYAVAVINASSTPSNPGNPEAVASVYVVDFVATAAFGAAINDAGTTRAT